MARKITFTFCVFVLVLCTFSTSTHADSILEANIRAALSQDPRSHALSPAQYEALVQSLTQKAEADGVASLSFAPAPVPADPNGPREVSACEGLPLLCWLAFYLGISLMHVWWLALGFFAGALIILFELHHYHHRIEEKKKPKLYV